MLWLLYSLFLAIGDSFKNLLNKKYLEKRDEYTVSWALRFFSLVFIIPLFLLEGIPAIGSMFFVALAVSSILNVVTTIMIMKALKITDISLAMPMLNFTPLFMLLTSPLILGEFPGIAGMAGIFLIVTGSYILNINSKKKGYAEPLKSIFRERGTLLMLAVAFVWSITANIDKLGIINSTPVFWLFSVHVVISIMLFPFAFAKNRKNIFTKDTLRMMPVGLVTAAALFFQMIALTLTLAAYVISVKRTSTIFSSIWGFIFLKEKNARNRLFGAAVMLVGVVIIALS